VGAEDDQVRVVRAEQIGHGPMRLSEQLVAGAAGGEDAPLVGVGAGQVAAHCLDYSSRRLTAGWAVKKDGWPSVDGAVERRELPAAIVNVEHGWRPRALMGIFKLDPTSP